MSLRLLILVKQFSPRTETFIYHDAVALQSCATVKVACLERLHGDARPFKPLEVLKYTKSRLRRKWDNQLYKFNIALDCSYAPLKRQLDMLLQDFQPDVIHLHFGIQALDFIDNLDFNGPIFITFHGYDATKLVKKSAIYRKRLHGLFQQSNIFPLATSASLFQYMSRFELRSDRSRVLYSGIELDFFQPDNRHRPAGKKIFTQISSFREKKGHVYLVQAFHRLLHEEPTLEAELWLAGGGPLEASIKDLVRKLGLDRQVRFFGWISQQEAVELLRQTDIFVHPSITTDEVDMESTTVAILEAMAMALPVFATRHSGIPEIVEHGVNGLLAEERNINDYVNSMKALLDWGPQPQNRRKIADNFSRQIHIRELLDAYGEAVDRCRTKKP